MKTTNPRIPLKAPLAFSVVPSIYGEWAIVLYDPRRMGRFQKGVAPVEYILPGIAGWLALGREDRGFRPVAMVAARHGYGPVVYEIALEMARRGGWWLTPGDEVGPEAEPIWRRFAERADVQRKKLPTPLKVHATEYLDLGAAMARGLPGFDPAQKRGDAFVEKLRRNTGLSRRDALDVIDSAANQLWTRRHMEVSFPNTARPSSRLSGGHGRSTKRTRPPKQVDKTAILRRAMRGT